MAAALDSNIQRPADLTDAVKRALREDVGRGDRTAALVPARARARAEIRVNEAATLCGSAWVNEVFRQLDPKIEIEWLHADGDRLEPSALVCIVHGHARAILTGERTALNFLQTLSGTATATRSFCDAIAGTQARILDTRKTLPGLRLAQKYAVLCGGGHNHRIGLFDAVLIKENHIAAVGSLAGAVSEARHRSPDVMIEVEVEDMNQLAEALETSADRIMLDNFEPATMRQAVELRDRHPGPRKELEASGGLDHTSVREIAATGVDCISIGALTKNLTAIDFSMRFVTERASRSSAEPG